MRTRTFSIQLPESDDPPSEFRLFAAGRNDSTKGPVFLTDAEAVVAAWQRHGVDLMIDLEHLSLDPDARNYDPDARGWGQLEVRNGEVWATGLRWTPDGERRLREKRQRYISPAFDTDKKGRVVDVLNVAITALPATHNAAPLVAASQRSKGMDEEKLAKYSGRLRQMLGMDQEDGAQIADAIKSMDPDAMLEVIVDLMAGAEPDVPAPEMEMADPPADGEDKPEDEQIAMAARSLTGAKSAGEVVAKLNAMSKAAAGAEKAERAALVAQNKDLFGEELQSWALSAPAKTLNDYISAARKNKPAVRSITPVQPNPSAGPSPADEQLTPEEEEVLKHSRISREKYLETRNAHKKGAR